MTDFLKKSWLFEVVDRTSQEIEASFTLVIPPQGVRVREGHRVSTTKTFNNVIIDDYGADNLELTIRGISGTARVFPTFRTRGGTVSSASASQIASQLERSAPTTGYNQRDAFYTFRNEIMRYKDNYTDFGNKELRVYDLGDEEAYRCVLLDFTLDRSEDNPFRYPFVINLFVYYRLDSKQAAKAQPVVIGKDPTDVLSRVDSALSGLTNALQAFRDVNRSIHVAAMNARMLAARLATVATSTIAIMETPLDMAKHLFDLLQDVGWQLNRVRTRGAITLMRYSTSMELIQSMMRDTLALYGSLLSRGTRASRDDIKPVNLGASAASTVIDGMVSQPEVLRERFTYNTLREYTVKAGDTLQSIAADQMGDSNLWFYIASVNDIPSNIALEIGSTIYLPVLSDLSSSEPNVFILSEDPTRDPFGTDIRLAPNGDFAVSDGGDLATISGIENLKQAVNNILMTRAGSIIKQSAYGISAVLGMAGQDLAYSYLRMSISNALLQDPRITDVQNLFIDIRGDKLYISMDIIPVGVSNLVSVSVLL